MAADLFKRRKALLLCGATLLIATPAIAQNVDGTPGSEENFELTEIIVTAQKRYERLIDTPQSVTAVTATDLEKLGATQLVDFANTVPGLQVTGQGAGLGGISMRGVTTGVDVGPTVGIYVDDIPYGSSTVYGGSSTFVTDVALFDLDRVEVLRGPQGTLYGASSMGGVLKYVTSQPSLRTFGGSVQAGASATRHGNASYNGNGVVNIPIVTDKVAVRASGFHSRPGGYFDNAMTGDRNVDATRVDGGRADILIEPAEGLTIRLTGFGQDIRRDGNAYADYTLQGQPLNDPLLQSHPLVEGFTSTFRVYSGTISYDFGGATLTSITGYQKTKRYQLADNSALYAPLLQSLGIPAIAVGNETTYLMRKFTEEARLASPTGDRFEWQLGGFYTHEDASVRSGLPAYGTGLVELPINLANATAPSLYREYAFFGDLTWHLTDRFDVTGGIRWAQNDQKYAQNSTGLLVPSAPAAKSDEGVTTYLVSGRYRFNDNVMAYASYATGFRPGGPNIAKINPTTGALVAPPAFSSDTLRSYQGGLKAETSDRRFSLDGSVFYIDWQDIQLATVVDGVSAIQNSGGGAHIKGAELALTARPTAGLTLSGAFAYNDGALDRADAALGARKGERLPNAARFTASINADYVFRQSDLQPTIGATWRYAGKRTASFDANAGLPQYRLPAYNLTDIRAGITLGEVNLQAYVHNLFDKRAQLSAATALSSLGGPAQVTILRPRTIGLTAGWYF
ncbi:TonB-dependent receptor [Niveispirillum sp.]|uniref:TonB-dependent receptor n=1 Tax=Niveispirillum sp. TaxID=1917217 RepID=UPI001B5E59B0|nr:TonB-dependent receptor [Niveispirillum sp.]MBP7335998.1 TonB-dependent receptor [Niveispirillum sp.]